MLLYNLSEENLVSGPHHVTNIIPGQIRHVKLEPGDYVFKIVVTGDDAVGKKTIIQTFTHEIFDDDYLATVGAAIVKKEYTFQGGTVACQLSIWDLAGQKSFKRARKSYLANAAAGILVFDVTRKTTFEHIEAWMEEFKLVNKSIPIVLVGNKIDLAEAREVNKIEAESLAKSLNASYIETSAKEGSNIEEVFEMLAYFLIKENFSQTESLPI
jgi:small GTP-binding protein